MSACSYPQCYREPTRSEVDAVAHKEGYGESVLVLGFAIFFAVTTGVFWKETVRLEGELARAAPCAVTAPAKEDR